MNIDTKLDEILSFHDGCTVNCPHTFTEFEQAKARLLQWGTRQRIDELNRYSKMSAIDRGFKLRDKRIAELQASLKDGGNDE